MSAPDSTAPTARVGLSIRRTHQRFLLRELHFTQQYASMYRCRLDALRDRVLCAWRRRPAVSHPQPPLCRLLELRPGQRAVCVGVAYKQMRLLPRFLDEYQRELIRIDAGEDDEEDAPIPASPTDTFDAPNTANTTNATNATNAQGECEGRLCAAGDEVFVEDDSGRVRLDGVDASRLCTGLVLCVDGTLRENGSLRVHTLALTDAREAFIPRGLPPPVCRAAPCYVAFVSGLRIALPTPPAITPSQELAAGHRGLHPSNRDTWNGNGAGAEAEAEAEAIKGRVMAELLVDYLSGHLGDQAMVTQATRIARLVIGGNSIAPTDELRLKRKVKLDPSDHVRLAGDRYGGGGAANNHNHNSNNSNHNNNNGNGSGTVTAARLMAELDPLLARLADTIAVDLMPGDLDVTNAFQPQQPLHPLLLPDSARRSSLALVTNPFEFRAFPGLSEAPTEGSAEETRGALFFVTSGQGLNDVSRETRHASRLDAMVTLLRAGCACPTAPNTLFSYPFRTADPFIFTNTPHCFVCCDQPEAQSRWEPLVARGEGENEEEEGEGVTPPAESVGGGKEDKEEEDHSMGVRLVCVPPFAQTGELVLVDVNHPQLETTIVNFALQL